MHSNIKLKLPTPKNFIILDLPHRTDRPCIPIEHLSQEESEQYAEELKQQFLDHYKKKKESVKLEWKPRIMVHHTDLKK